jgi:hypothetical protein
VIDELDYPLVLDGLPEQRIRLGHPSTILPSTTAPASRLPASRGELSGFGMFSVIQAG